MKTVNLESFEDEEYGSWGIGIVGVTRKRGMNAATEGLLLAHDLVEHVNGLHVIGSIDDELEALGAIWFTRGHLGDLRRDSRGSAYTPEQNIASDVVRMLRDAYLAEDDVTLTPLRTRSCEADDAFELIVQYAREDMRAELDPEPGDTEWQPFAESYMRCVVPRLRVGYRKARRMYGDFYRANDLFWTIADAVDGVCKKAERLFGEPMRLHYGFRDGTAVVTLEREAWE